jgi:hypothetical protein
MRKNTKRSHLARQVAALLTVAAALSATPVVAKDIVIHAGHLIDGIASRPTEKVSILIHDDRISGVQQGFRNPGRRRSDRRALVQAGRYADIIAVQGDPLADITELQRVQFVMKGGAVYKSGGKMLR